MCNHTTLAQSNEGYIFECKECKRFQVAFGTSLVSLTPEQFVLFRKFINKEVADIGDPQEASFAKTMAIELVHGHCYMLVTYSELIVLNELINKGWFTSELLQVVHDLTSPS